MKDALLLIVERSSVAAGQAMACLRAIDADSPVVQQRYNATVEAAFEDFGAQFSASERKLIAGYVDSAANGGRCTDIRVRLTVEEKATLQEMAADAGQNVSDYVRSRLGL